MRSNAEHLSTRTFPRRQGIGKPALLVVGNKGEVDEREIYSRLGRHR